MKRLRVFLVSAGRRTITFPNINPPVGILSLAAYLRDRLPVDIAVLDQKLGNRSCDEVVRLATAFEADVVGFSALTPAAYLLPGLTRGIREALPNALIVMGGPHVSAFGVRAMTDTVADAAVIGEGEIVLEQIVLARSEGSGFESIAGLVWRNEAGEVIANPGMVAPIEDLDALPFPAYDLIDMEPYFSIRAMSNMPPNRYVTISTSRGCPYRCIYCHRIFGKRFRSQSAERILDEIVHLNKMIGLESVELIDDIFNLRPARVFEFCAGLHQRNLNLKLALPNAMRGDTLSEEMIDALADAGLYYTACALESGSPRIQEYIGKRLDIPRFLEGVEMLAKRGVHTHGFSMMGFPTETEEEIRQTIDVVCHSKLHTATFFTATPYPNTELYALVEKTHPEKLAKISYEDTDYTAIIVNLSDVPDDKFYALQRLAWRRFYYNPWRLLRIARVSSDPFYLPRYVPMLLLKQTKGLFGTRAKKGAQ